METRVPNRSEYIYRQGIGIVGEEFVSAVIFAYHIF